MEDENARIIAKLNKLYVSNKERFVMMRPGGSIIIPKIGARYMRLADSNLRKHLAYEYAVSVFGGKTGSKFLCLDVDKGGMPMVHNVVATLGKIGLDCKRIHVSSSGGKGYHVEIFFDALAPYASLQQLYRYVLVSVGATEAMVELRPSYKQAIKLPLSIHPRTGNICWFWDMICNKPIETQEHLLHIEPLQLCELNRVLATLPAIREPKEPRVSSTGEWRPGEWQSMLEPAEEGTRHMRMVKLATALRYHGADAESCSEQLLQWHHAQSDGYCRSSYAEVLRDIDQIVRWAYREAFRQPGAGEIMVLADEMQCVMQQPRRSTRMVFFLVLCIVKIDLRMKQTEMCKLLGLSPITVTKEINYLNANKTIQIHSGRSKRTSNGYLCKQVNRYSVPKGKIEGHTRRAFQPARHFVVLEKNQLLEDFHSAYFGAIHKMFGDHDLHRHMRPKEYCGYQQYINGCVRAASNADEQNAPNTNENTSPTGCTA